ncbi:MAG: MFS transporter [Actinomycetota bacterium]
MSEPRGASVSPETSIQGLFLLFGVAIAAFFPFLAPFLSERGVRPDDIGIVVAAMALARVVANPIWGHLSDTSIGRKRALQIGLVLSAVFAVAIWASGGSFAALLATAVLFAGVGGAVGPNIDAMAIAHLGEDRMHEYGRIRGWESLVYGITALVLGVVLDRVGVDAGMLVYAVACLVMLGWSTTFRVPQVRHEGTHGRAGAVGTVLRGNPRFLAFLGATLLLWFGFSGAWNFIGLKILDEGGGASLIGLGAGLGGLIELPMMRSSSNLSERFGVRAVFVAGCSCYAVGFLLWGLIEDPTIVSILTFLEGVAFALVFTMSVVIVGKLVQPSLYSTGQAITATVGFGIAPVLGGLVGGWVYAHLGPQTLYLAASAIAAIAAVVAHRALDDPALVRRQAVVESGAPPIGDLEPEA